MNDDKQKVIDALLSSLKKPMKELGKLQKQRLTLEKENMV